MQIIISTFEKKMYAHCVSCFHGKNCIAKCGASGDTLITVITMWLLNILHVIFNKGQCFILAATYIVGFKDTYTALFVFVAIILTDTATVVNQRLMAILMENK